MGRTKGRRDDASARALRAMDEGRAQDAEDAWVEQVRRHPDDAEAWFQLGTLRAGLGQVALGLDGLRRADALVPDQPGVLHNLGNALRELGDLDAAESMFRRLLAQEPGFAEGWSGLGNVLRAQGDLPGARDAHRAAIRLDPGFQPAWIGLGDAEEALGRPIEALRAFTDALALDRDPRTSRRLGVLHALHGTPAVGAALLRQALRHDPDDGLAEHLLAALEQRVPDRPPDRYVVELFDRYADRFDVHLVGALGYRAPDAVWEAVQAVRAGSFGDRVVDLGCGTGLMGARIAGQAGQLVGVDLSPRMVDRARFRGVYAEVRCTDVIEGLDEGPWDAVLAVDVLVYVGDLRALFAAVAATLAPGGLFAFTTEIAGEGEGMGLTSTGRYTHGPAYVEACARGVGLIARRRTREVLRTERDLPVFGDVFVLGQLTGSSAAR